MRAALGAWVTVAAAAAQLGPLPATFQGKLPCADCPGITYHVNLFTDQSYFLRTTYLDRGTARDEVGRYVVTGSTLKLDQSGEQFAIEKGSLRKLDRDGKPIDSKLNYHLRRAAKFRELEPNVRLSGMFQYMADAASFDNTLAMCADGRIRTQDAPYLLARAMQNRFRGYDAWRFVADNWELVITRFPSNSIARMLSGIVSLAEPEQAEAIESFLDAAPPEDDYTPVFSHNDLGIEHVLVDPLLWTVTGIIDWSDAAIVDPAVDLGRLHRDLGSHAPATDRVLFYARCGLLEDLAYGLDTDRPAYVEKSLAALAWLFPPPAAPRSP